jgi:hypothetical protein
MSGKNAIAWYLTWLAPAIFAADPKPPAFLEQNWSDQTRFAFWFEDQGSLIMPLDWFMRLEVSGDSQVKFVSNLDRYGFIADQGFATHTNPNPGNPLPIGFTKNTTAKDRPWVGLTCAACHTNQISYGDKSWLIEGGPGMLDFDRFLADMVAAVDDTSTNAAKKKRFWNNGVPSAADAALFLSIQTALDWRKSVNTPPASAGPAGFGRVDAFDHIFNQVLAAIGAPSDTRPPDAPASYPFLWDIAQHDFVQWNGSAPNLGVGKAATGSLIRNIGEVLGVFGEVTVSKELNQYLLPTYASSANSENLQQIEEWIAALRSPQWPSELGSIDANAQAAGAALYQTNCVSCHELIPRNDPVPYQAFAKMVPVTSPQLQTDRQEIDNFRTRTADAGVLTFLPDPLSFATLPRLFGPDSPVKDLTGYVALGVYMRQNPPDLLTLGINSLWLATLRQPTLVAYKGRPLDGIWATAPYLHNGSVPNLTELLTAPENRKPWFCVGDGQYDPENVGYKTYYGSAKQCPPGTRTQMVDTSRTGSSNLGHSYGTTLTATEKRRLIEYLKSL